MAHQALTDSPLFAGLADDQLDRIGECGREIEVPEGELVFAEGSRGTEVFVLLSGRVQISVELEKNSKPAPVHTIMPGKVFGEFALVADHERSASARAVHDSRAFAFPRDAFHELAESDPSLGYVVLKNLGEILVGRIIKTTRDLRASLMY